MHMARPTFTLRLVPNYRLGAHPPPIASQDGELGLHADNTSCCTMGKLLLQRAPNLNNNTLNLQHLQPASTSSLEKSGMHVARRNAHFGARRNKASGPRTPFSYSRAIAVHRRSTCVAARHRCTWWSYIVGGQRHRTPPSWTIVKYCRCPPSSYTVVA